MAGPLAQKIRAKFPGVYDDLDDAALEQAVLAKHPEYADLVEPEAPKEERTVGGFMANILPSAGKFIKDTVTGAYEGSKLLNPVNQMKAVGRAVMDPGGEAERVAGVAKAAPGALLTAAKDRYGSVEALKNTAYTDPVGILGDISTVAGVGAATKAPKIAGVLAKIEAATSPARMMGAPLAKAADLTSSAVIRGTLRPSAAVRKDFGGAQGVADAVKKERVFSEASATKKLNQSTASADKLLADRQAAGTRGVSRRSVTDAVLGDPVGTAAQRARLGDADQSDALMQRASDIETRNPEEIPLTEAQALKREAQTLAYESGADNQTVKKLTEQAIARALRQGIEGQVPEVGPINERSQRLLGTKLAFAEAEDRPQALTNMMSLGAGGTVGAGTGDPIQALLTAAMMKGMNSPRAGALTGIGINELGKAAINPDLLRSALIARLLGQEQDR